MLVELLTGNSRLNSSVKIFRVDVKYPVHLRQVDTNAARKRCDVPFERGTGTERDNRRAALGAELDDRGNLGGATSEGDRVRGMRSMIGLVLAMLRANWPRG